MSLYKLASRNCLFLICPTDHLENILSQNYSGKAFFYTALGVGFNWDINTQHDIVKLINNRNIDHLVFVTKHMNRFYKKTDVINNEYSLLVDYTMLKIEKTLPNCFLQQSHPVLKTMLLASRYLQKQQKYILETSELGKELIKRKIVTRSFVYHEDTKVFYAPKTIERKVLLNGRLSPN